MKNKLLEKITYLKLKKPSDVSNGKRLMAYVVDWVVGGILTGLPAVLLYSGITKRTDMFSDLYVFETLGYPKAYGILIGLLCLIVAILYYVYIPLRGNKGQTYGKKLAGFKIVKADGKDVDLKTLLIRQVLGIFLIESSVLIVSNYIRQMTSISLNYYVDYYWAIAGMLITLISVILCMRTDSHRAIHDYLAGTCLVCIPQDEGKQEDQTQKESQSKNPSSHKKNKQKKSTSKG